MRHYSACYATMAAALACGAFASPGQDAPPKAPDEEARRVADEFGERYRLADGEVLKAIPDPLTRARMAYYKDRPGLGVPQDSSNVHVYYRWRDGALAKDPSWVGGGESLQSIFSPLIGLEMLGVEGDRVLLKTKIDGDFIVRNKAPTKEVVAAAEAILRRDFGLPVRLTLAELERPCVVVRGRYKFTPDPDQPPLEPGGMDRILVRAVGLAGGVTGPNRDVTAAGGFSGFLSQLSGHTGRRFLDEVEAGPGKVFEWRIANYGVGIDDDHLDLILKNLATDTGLTFERANRRVRVLTAERAD